MLGFLSASDATLALRKRDLRRFVLLLGNVECSVCATNCPSMRLSSRVLLGERGTAIPVARSLFIVACADDRVPFRESVPQSLRRKEAEEAFEYWRILHGAETVGNATLPRFPVSAAGSPSARLRRP